MRRSGIRYDPEFANRSSREQMKAAGATLDQGVWTFQGRPVMLKIIVRVEDERRDVGDLFRAALEGAGFQVQPIYQPFGPATLAVYASDPLTFQWHAYTEGWSRTSPDRYDFGTINQMYAPWLGNMPGWLETGFWQYENEELDRIGQQLYRGEFGSKDERDDLYRQMTSMGLDESVRLWLATALQSFPARNELENLNIDIVGGPKSALSLREASVTGAEEIRVGNLWIWTDRTVWNPVGGFGDAYSSDIYKNLVDAPVINHPFSGLPIPFRADLRARDRRSGRHPRGSRGCRALGCRGGCLEACRRRRHRGEQGHLRLQQVFPGAIPSRASKSPRPISSIRLPSPGSWRTTRSAFRSRRPSAITSRPFLETFKGFRLLDDNRLETYVDFWHFEPSYIASYAVAGGVSTPWELLYAMDDVVF